MRCSQARKMIIKFEDSEMPPPLQQHLHKCPVCRAFAERSAWIRNLIALKRFEQPVPGTWERLAADIRRRLRGAEGAQKVRVVEPFGAWIPVMRYGVAAALVILAGLQLGVQVRFLRPGVSADLTAPVQREAREMMPAAAERDGGERMSVFNSPSNAPMFTVPRQSSTYRFVNYQY